MESLSYSKYFRLGLTSFSAFIALNNRVALAADWPNPANINELSKGATPKNTVRAIKAD